MTRIGRCREYGACKCHYGGMVARVPVPPLPHPDGHIAPAYASEALPRHVAIVMDGNGRWANERGLPRTKGHEAGEQALFDVVHGALEIGLECVSAYAFSTENWKRSPDEVRFLMGFNREVMRRRRDELNDLGVRVVWSGRPQGLWKSVVRELQRGVELTRDNSVMTLNMCVNYGGQPEIVDAARALAERVRTGDLLVDDIDEQAIASHLYHPDLPPVDLFMRSSGEQRISNFLLWQVAYAELVFLPDLWPDVDRRHLWYAVDCYVNRDRRFGAAVDVPKG